jgi:hypothetical protein
MGGCEARGGIKANTCYKIWRTLVEEIRLLRDEYFSQKNVCKNPIINLDIFFSIKKA